MMFAKKTVVFEFEDKEGYSTDSFTVTAELDQVYSLEGEWVLEIVLTPGPKTDLTETVEENIPFDVLEFLQSFEVSDDMLHKELERRQKNNKRK